MTQNRTSNRANAHRTVGSLAEEANALLEATKEVADHKVTEARDRVVEALEYGQETYEDLRNRALKSAKAADKVIRTHPYQTLGVVFGTGLLAGLLLSRRG